MRTIEMLRRAQRQRHRCRRCRCFTRDVGRGLLRGLPQHLGPGWPRRLALGPVRPAVPTCASRSRPWPSSGCRNRHEAARDQLSGNLLVRPWRTRSRGTRHCRRFETAAREQANGGAVWIARRYKVAPEPVAPLVQEAWSIGQRAKLDPTLILAIMAVESSFNPFAQSPVGAQGLMQVMTGCTTTSTTPSAATHAAFDPITNLRVGVQVLQGVHPARRQRQEGLRHYVGAAQCWKTTAATPARVVLRAAALQAVASGKSVCR